MEWNGTGSYFVLRCAYLKLKLNAMMMASPFGFGWFWTKRERERAERKSFSFYGADLARGGCVIFGPSSFVTEIVASHQSHSHQLPAQSFSLGRFVIFWHYVVCTTSIIRYDINTEYTSQVSSTRTCNTALQHQIVYLNELLIPT